MMKMNYAEKKVYSEMLGREQKSETIFKKTSGVKIYFSNSIELLNYLKLNNYQITKLLST